MSTKTPQIWRLNKKFQFGLKKTTFSENFQVQREGIVCLNVSGMSNVRKCILSQKNVSLKSVLCRNDKFSYKKVFCENCQLFLCYTFFVKFFEICWKL